VCMGGGGFGDPLERDPALVLKDVKNSLVSNEYAEKVYGVIIETPAMNVDFSKTEEKRAEIRSLRRKGAGGVR